MNKKSIYPLIATLAVLACAYLLFSHTLVSGKPADAHSTGLDDIEKLEDLIIINGLEMSSENPPREGSIAGDGTVIYDDGFDAVLPKQQSIKKEIKISKQQPETAATIIAALKKEDPRWHLRTHAIRKGENLWIIANRYRVDHTLIIKSNNITDPDMLGVGKIISVPTRRDFTVKPKKRSAATHMAVRRAGRELDIPTPTRPGTRIDHVIEKSAELSNAEENDRDAKSESTSPDRERTKNVGRVGFTWPLRGKITSSFGRRIDPFSRKRAFHCGLDISANVGTPVKAAAGGRVIFSGWKDGYGNVVIIKHKQGYITVYAHNNKNYVSENDSVDAGKIIAESGMTGAVTGAHLHFEVRKYLTPINPMRFLR